MEHSAPPVMPPTQQSDRSDTVPDSVRSIDRPRVASQRRRPKRRLGHPADGAWSMTAACDIVTQTSKATSGPPANKFIGTISKVVIQARP